MLSLPVALPLCAHRGAVGVDEDLIEELEGVAILDLALEIDVVAEGADRLCQHGMRHLAVGRGDREVAVDGTFRVGELAGNRAVAALAKEPVSLRSEAGRVWKESVSTGRS